MTTTSPPTRERTNPTDDAATADRGTGFLAALAGVVAAGIALGVAELVAAFSAAAPSPVVAVGDVVVERTPGDVVRTAIDTLGENDKPALVIGILVTSLVVGAALGAVGRRRPVVPVIGFGAFGLVGVVAGVANDGDTVLSTMVGSVVGAVCGVAALRGLLGRLPAEPAASSSAAEPGPAAVTAPTDTTDARTAHVVPVVSPLDPPATRRSFFGWTAAGAATAVVAGAAGRRLAGRGSVESARLDVAAGGSFAGPADVVGDLATLDDVSGVAPYVTPNEDFYRIDTALVVPQVDPAGWSLSIVGMVDEPLEIGFDELLDMEMIAEAVTISCVSNDVGGDLVGNAVWQGVPLATLLDRVGVDPEASQLVGRSVDGWTAGFPLELARDGRPAMVAVGMNGEPLPTAHGFPARLIVPGLYGYVSATKWLSQIEITTWDGFDGYWIPRGWSKEGPIKTQSRIDVPRRNAEVTAGSVAVGGVAWAPTRGVERVEIRVDDGDWAQARLGEVVSDRTWVQWVYDWDATPGSHTLRVRATDGDGDTQSSDEVSPAPNGAEGWHTITVDVT